ncbi:MAG TPA: response regulator [Acidimicrobiia bacterium]|nr:response regulator [Acidimicrobiia bacterium]
MPTVVVASDANWVRDHVRAALCGPGFEVIEVEHGPDMRRVVADRTPDLVILDFQIGNMGGVAVALDLRLEESGDRLPHVPILILLDREADKFLARRSTADAMLVKPIDAGTVRRSVKTLLAAEEERRAAAADHDLEAGTGPGSGRRVPAETPSGPEEAVG